MTSLLFDDLADQIALVLYQHPDLTTAEISIRLVNVVVTRVELNTILTTAMCECDSTSKRFQSSRPKSDILWRLTSHGAMETDETHANLKSCDKDKSTYAVRCPDCHVLCEHFCVGRRQPLLQCPRCQAQVGHACKAYAAATTGKK